MQKCALSIILPGVSYQEAPYQEAPCQSGLVPCQSGLAPLEVRRAKLCVNFMKALNLATHYFPYVRGCWLIMNQNRV